MKIVILSDGQFGEVAKKGLGTKWLDTYVPGNWVRKLENDLNRLEIIL